MPNTPELTRDEARWMYVLADCQLTGSAEDLRIPDPIRDSLIIKECIVWKLGYLCLTPLAVEALAQVRRVEATAPRTPAFFVAIDLSKAADSDPADPVALPEPAGS